MLILALDTTTRTATAAARLDGHDVGTWVGDPAVSQAAQLPQGLRETLAVAGRTLADVDVLAVAVGPGSFTGLRVGIASMQGLAVALGRPLLGVSGLDALAALVEETGEASGRFVAPWVDAWRGEVFAGLYHDGRAIRPPEAGLPATLAADVPPGDMFFIGDGALAHRAAISEVLGVRAAFAADLTPAIAATLARLAEVRVAAGERPGPDAIAPLYVRRPDVEATRDARRAG